MTTKLTIIQQNDTHGYMEAHPEFFWGFEKPYYRLTGGLARIAGYVKKLKQEQENVLFIDGGDLFHGTGPAVLSQGTAMLKLINAMPLDAFVPGNWDYAYGAEQLQYLTSKMNCPVTALNVHHHETNKTLFLPFVIKELYGCKAGIIGLTYPYVHETMPVSFSSGLSFSLGLEELPDTIRVLRDEQKVDIVIVVSHMGLPLDVKLASQIRGIDIILSGHSHDRLTKPITQNGCIIIQSGASGSFLGRLDVTIENGKITATEHKLIPLLAEDFPEDEEMLELIVSTTQPYREVLSEEIGMLQSPLHRMTLNEAPMDRLITDAYLSFIEADVALSHGWRYGAPVLPGIVQVKHLYQMIPTNPKLFLLELEGAELLKALEQNLEQVFAADPFVQKGGYVLRSSNMMMAYKPYNPAGHRIQHIEINGMTLRLNKTYRIIGGGEQILKSYQSNRQILEADAHQALKAYFSLKKEVTIAENKNIFSI